MPTEVDPYLFVRLPEGDPDRKLPLLHDRYHIKDAGGTDRGLSGRLVCRLTAKTPLFVYDPAFARLSGNSHEEATFPVRRGRAIIPGSSLKGVVRSVAEAAEPCCFTLFDGFYRGRGITNGKVLDAELPAGYAHCSSVRELCPACRLFGSMLRDMSFAGKVYFSDAVAEACDFTLGESITLDVLSAPKPEARPRFYTQSDGRTVRGRKFYRHRLNGVLSRDGNRKDHQNKTVQPVNPGAVFTFEVEYTDVRTEELRLLLFALVLEPGLWHKVGMGKPIGLGSTHIEITSWMTLDLAARYRNLGEGTEELTGEALQAELATWLKPYQENDASNLQDLREVWRSEHDYEVRYQMVQP